MWSSSLTDSTLKGKPDNQSLDFSSRFNSLSDIMDVTSKPVIFDGDNGGRLEHLSFTVRTLERLGVSAIIEISINWSLYVILYPFLNGIARQFVCSPIVSCCAPCS